MLTHPRLMLLSATVTLVAFAIGISQTLHPAVPDWAQPTENQPIAAPVTARRRRDLEDFVDGFHAGLGARMGGCSGK